MHEFFKIKSSKPIPKFILKKKKKKINNFEKPQFCENPKNLGFKEWNA